MLRLGIHGAAQCTLHIFHDVEDKQRDSFAYTVTFIREVQNLLGPWNSFTCMHKCVCIYIYIYIHTHTHTHIHMTVVLKLMLCILLCWPMTSEANVGDMAVEVGPSCEYSIKFCCHATDDSQGTV